MEHFPHIITGLFVLCLIGGAILLRYERNTQAQATPLPKRIDDRKPKASSGTHNPSSTSHRKPMATLNRKQRRTLASMSRRGKLPKMAGNSHSDFRLFLAGIAIALPYAYLIFMGF